MAERMVGFEIRGIKEFRQGLRKADGRMDKDLRVELRKIAALTAIEARALAAERTHRRTGDLVAGIKPFVTLKGAGIRSNATHRGYPYPRRLEFEGRKSSETGPRASLFPAFRRTSPTVRAAGDKLMQTMLRDLS